MMNSNVRISVTGGNIDLFLKLYVINKIDYRKLKKAKNEVKLTVSYGDYLLLKSKKSTYSLTVIKEYGVIKYKKLIQKNVSLIIAFLLSIVYLCIISNITFKIEIVHGDFKIRKLVYDELSQNGISKYSFIPSFKKRRQILDKILNDNKNDLEWIEMQRNGSILSVKVTEKIINEENDDTKPRNIVAKKSGIILSITAQHGEILRNKNDYVNQGDVIISGDIMKDDVVKDQVRAEGSVYAETWYLVNVSYPLNYEQTIYLSKVKNNVIINFFNKEISLFKNYEKNYIENTKTLIKDKVFPFSVRIEKQRKVKVTTQRYTKNQALNKALEEASCKMKKRLASDEYIIDKKVLNFTMNDSTIEVEVFFRVYSNITAYESTKEITNEENKE